jgi:long-chain acyl-CoA synthetase
MGREFEKRQSRLLFEKSIERLKPEEDVALIAYTSGTTGFPKGSLLTHSNMLKMALNLNAVDPKKPDDEFVSFLPLPWIGEQMMSIATALAIGFTVNFPEEPETAMQPIFTRSAPTWCSARPGSGSSSRSVIVKHHGRLLASSALSTGSVCPSAMRWPISILSVRNPPLHWKIMYAISYRAFVQGAERTGLGFSQHPQRHHRRRRLGAGRVPFLPCLRGEPETDLRADRDKRHFLHPPGR